MSARKAVFFATTALVAFAGAAAADVTISGSAEMGINSNGRTVDGVESQLNATFFQSVDVRFSMSGESDNGLSFGAVVDLDDATERTDALGDRAGDFADFTVFISGDFGTLTMGDTDGALDRVLTEVAGVGSIADNETRHPGYNGNAGLDGFYQGQVLRYDYTIGGLSIAVSAEIDDNGDADVGSTATVAATQFDSAVLGIGVAYEMGLGSGELTLGLGYQQADDASAVGLSASYASNGLTVGLSAMQWRDTPVRFADPGQTNAGQFNFQESGPTGTVGGNPATAALVDVDHFGVGVTYQFDAFAIHANYGMFDYISVGGSAAVVNMEADGFGLAASYDLGGGASMHFGYGRGERSGTIAGTAFNNEYDNWSLGLAMSF